MAPKDAPAAASSSSDNEVARGTFGVVGAVIGMGVTGIMAMSFGAGYGARSFESSRAYKDLLEKFPDAPAPEAEAMARRGATRAFLAGTGLAAAMGVGAVALARAYGIKDVRDLGDEVRRWLPSHQTLRSQVEPGAEQLKRSISNTIDAAKIDETFKATTIGRYLSKQGERSVKAQKDAKMEQWEKDAIEKLQAMEKDTTPGFGGAKK